MPEHEDRGLALELDAAYEVKEVLKRAVSWAEEHRYADAAAFSEALYVALNA